VVNLCRPGTVLPVLSPCRCRRYIALVLQATAELLISPPWGGTVLRYNGFKLSIFALVIAATLASVPAASAKSIIDDIFVGGTQIGTMTLTQGGTCDGMSIASSSVCVAIQMTSGAVRLGGPVVGFSGNVNVGGTTMISDVSVGSLLSGACGGVGAQTICLDAHGSATTTTLFFCVKQRGYFDWDNDRGHPRGWSLWECSNLFRHNHTQCHRPRARYVGPAGNRLGRSSWFGSSPFLILTEST